MTSPIQWMESSSCPQTHRASPSSSAASIQASMPRPTLLLYTIMIASSIRLAVASSRFVSGYGRAGFSAPSTSSLLGFKFRGGGTDGVGRAEPPTLPSRDVSSSAIASASAGGDGGKKFITLAEPAPGSPFHYAFPVHSLDAAREFYGDVLACEEGRSSEKWQDYSLHGHQIVCHWVGDDYRCVDYYNPVDGDEVPVPHAGLALTVEQFHALANRLRKAGVQFIIEPHLRFQGAPGEQWTMFFKDPSGNNLEFKAMTKVGNLFAKYNVD